MDDYLISQFIDNELALDEKLYFVEKVHNNKEFTEQTVSYLEQEKLLQVELKPWKPTSFKLGTNRFSLRQILHSCWQPTAGFAAATVLAAFIFFGVEDRFQQRIAELMEVPTQNQAVNYRFVLSQEATKVEILGSFTNWQKVPLLPTGAGAYWEVTLPVGYGEHKYSFVVDGKKLLPDPTVAAREPDDFGTINSIIRVEV